LLTTLMTVDVWLDAHTRPSTAEWLLHGELEGKYSLESTDPRESEFAPTCVRNSVLSYLSITYLLIWWFGPADATATHCLLLQ